MFTKYASIQIWSSEKEICARNRIFNVVNIEVTSMHEISSLIKYLFHWVLNKNLPLHYQTISTNEYPGD
jgi:hypothetical protein